MKNVTINPYFKKDGKLMVYVNKFNDSSRVSLGISDRVYTSKLTDGQNKLLNNFLKAINEAEPICDFSDEQGNSHAEPKAKLDCGVCVFITDVANVGGVKVGEDGMYFSKNGKLYDSLAIKNKLADLI